MVDLRDVAQVAKLPIEMVEAGDAINKAICNEIIVRIRVDNSEGLYLDADKVVTGCIWDASNYQIVISGSGFRLEFEYEKFELNAGSGDKFTKFYFRKKDSTLGITVNY